MQCPPSEMCQQQHHHPATANHQLQMLLTVSYCEDWTDCMFEERSLLILNTSSSLCIVIWCVVTHRPRFVINSYCWLKTEKPQTWRTPNGCGRQVCVHHEWLTRLSVNTIQTEDNILKSGPCLAQLFYSEGHSCWSGDLRSPERLHSTAECKPAGLNVTFLPFHCLIILRLLNMLL